MNNPFYYEPDRACNEAFSRLIGRIEALGDTPVHREFLAGKMLGVLIAEDSDGNRHTLYAFSGQLGNGGFYCDGFVGPVFDYLDPNGYFKTHEAAISCQNREIANYESTVLRDAQLALDNARAAADAEVSQFKDKCRRSKAERDARRSSSVSEAELAEMIRQSQFEKAELHRLKKAVGARVEPFAARLEEARRHLASMKQKRRSDSEALQQWLFDSFKLPNALGQVRSLSEIFDGSTPPSGAGECCAPKLLNAAFSRELTPLKMAEYWYGAPKQGEVRIHGNHYPACRGKCLPVLTWMMQGLDIESDTMVYTQIDEPTVLFQNQWFCVIEKPSGMLSVPGKSGADSVQSWLENKFGADSGVKVAHRLDQDTSGLIVAAFGTDSYKILQELFATRRVKKTYEAILEGDYRKLGVAPFGHIELPIMPDLTDRPRQRVDYTHGRLAVTDYRFVGDVSDGCSRILFYPHTGRTHQLRVTAASQSALGMPIVGDRLYGHRADGQRLQLHACHIEFDFPTDGNHYSFDSKASIL